MPATFDFNHPIDRRYSDSLKWNRYLGKDILPLWVADMDFAAPPAVINALHQRVNHGVFGYGMPTAQLVKTVIAMLYQTYHWQVEPEWIVWLPGLVSGLNLACRAVGRDKDQVLTTTPIYPPFLTAPKLSKRRVLTTKLVCQNKSWEFDFDKLEKTITPKTSLFILCNPHNPTGRVYGRDELLRLFEICRRNKIIICSDEIHCQLILCPKKRHIPMASLGKEFEQQTITLMAPSKTYNIPGLACSFAVIPNEKLRRSFRAVQRGIVGEVNVMGYAAALAAYQDGGQWLKELLHYLRINRDFVEDAIDNMPKITMNHVEATYLAWIDARQMGVQNPALFFEHAGVGLSNGKDFGAPGYVRLNFGCPRPQLAKALQRIQKALEKSV
jgi:cysteine-S-conjugate beta-lyase